MKNKIKEYRYRLGLSQQELANACGVSRETISRLESNHSNPSLILSIRIAKQLDTSVESIFLLEEEETFWQ